MLFVRWILSEFIVERQVTFFLPNEVICLLWRNRRGELVYRGSSRRISPAVWVECRAESAESSCPASAPQSSGAGRQQAHIKHRGYKYIHTRAGQQVWISAQNSTMNSKSIVLHYTLNKHGVFSQQHSLNNNNNNNRTVAGKISLVNFHLRSNVIKSKANLFATARAFKLHLDCYRKTSYAPRL